MELQVQISALAIKQDVHMWMIMIGKSGQRQVVIQVEVVPLNQLQQEVYAQMHNSLFHLIMPLVEKLKLNVIPCAKMMPLTAANSSPWGRTV